MISFLGRHASSGCRKYVIPTLCRPNVTSYCSNWHWSNVNTSVTSNACHRHEYHSTRPTTCSAGATGWCTSHRTRKARLSRSSLVEVQSRTFSKSSWLSTDNPLSDQIEYSCDKVETEAKENFCIVPNFITDQEEKILLQEIDRHFRGIRYEYDHWDNAIHGFRETEKSKWSPETQGILRRVRDAAFSSEATQLPLVHVLDLAENGYIKAHVDSVKFCGPTIAGLSLISPSVLRLEKEGDSSLWLKAVLPAGSLYIMRNQIRFDYTHEILKDEESFIRGERVKRGRRVSVMFRDQPASDHSQS